MDMYGYIYNIYIYMSGSEVVCICQKNICLRIATLGFKMGIFFFFGGGMGWSMAEG